MLRLKFPLDHWCAGQFTIDGRDLSSNPNAVSLLEENPTWINWDMLCLNPNAMHLIQRNLSNINWLYVFESERDVLDRKESRQSRLELFVRKSKRDVPIERHEKH